MSLSPPPAAPRARRWLRTAALAAAPALAAPFAGACGDSITSPDDAAGTYALVSINGQSLPYVYADNGYTGTVTDAQLVLRSDRSYRFQSSTRFVDQRTGAGETVPFVDTGVYSLNSGGITFSSDRGADGPFYDNTGRGTISGSTLRVETYTFSRR